MTRAVRRVEEFVLRELYPTNTVEVVRRLAERAVRNERLSNQTRTAVERLLQQPFDSSNPEIFPILFALGERVLSVQDEEALALALLIHSRIEPMSRLQKTRPKILRLAHSHGTILRSVGLSWEDISDAVLDKATGVCLLWPYDSLFEDIVPAEHYPTTVHQPLCKVAASENLTAAIQMLKDFSPALQALFECVVRTIAVLPEHDASRKSFSCRTAYLGGIFINLSREPSLVAEDLMHETVHQALWAKWCLQNVWFPPEQEVFSPVTGRWRPADVMTHAYVIYLIAIALHRSCAARGNQTSERRLPALESAIAPLHLQLKAVHNSTARDLLTFAEEALSA